MTAQHDRTQRVLERVARWRVLFTGWQLGTRTDRDPEAAAIRDHREATLMLRVEANALVSLLIAKKVITEADWDRYLELSGNQLQADLEARFPGVHATDIGLQMDPTRVAPWMRERNWPQ